MADATTTILGIAGSLRRGSYNAAVLRAAAGLAPGSARIDVFERLGEIPLYDEDVRQRGLPPAAQDLRARIAAADGVLLVSPEYNYSVPGVLKNAIDWASRPPDQPFAGKPVAVMGASPGRLGTARAQYHLRQMFVFLDALVMPRPEVMVAGVSRLVDDQGRLTDADTAERLREFMAAFVDFVAFVRRGRGG